MDSVRAAQLTDTVDPVALDELIELTGSSSIYPVSGKSGLQSAQLDVGICLLEFSV